MNKDIAMKWVFALRSGKYTQGRGALKNKYGAYCCLGVLCDISALGSWDGLEGFSSTYTVRNEEALTQLPESVVRWADMRSKNGDFPKESLMRLNDQEKNSFSEIADVIEKNWEIL